MQLAIFENYKIRRHFDEKTETWFFSVVDIVAVLTDSPRPRTYWTDLKRRLSEDEGFIELHAKCVQLKLETVDGKKYKTDCADTETLLRIVQSIPSPKAEPFKRWLAKVGYERMQEIADPELSINRARENWKKHGRSDKWIQQRMMGQETRNKLTDYWATHGIKEGVEYATLTNIIHQEWSGVGVKEHKDLKALKTNNNLRDHMSESELIFTALAELATRQVAENSEADGMKENTKAAKVGGGIAKKARLELEEKTGQKVVTSDNHLQKLKKYE